MTVSRDARLPWHVPDPNPHHRHSQAHLALAEHQLGEVQDEIAKLNLPPY